VARRALCQACGFLHDERACPNCGAPRGSLGRFWREEVREHVGVLSPITTFLLAFLASMGVGSAVGIDQMAGWALLVAAIAAGLVGALVVLWSLRRDAAPPGTLRARAARLDADLETLAERREQLDTFGRALGSDASPHALHTHRDALGLIEQNHAALTYERALIDTVRWRNGVEQTLAPARNPADGVAGMQRLSDYGDSLASRLGALPQPHAQELAESVRETTHDLRRVTARRAEDGLAGVVRTLHARGEGLAPEGSDPDDPLAARLRAHLDALPQLAEPPVYERERLRLELDDALDAANPHRTTPRVRS
jgi:hypothetical protein